MWFLLWLGLAWDGGSGLGHVEIQNTGICEIAVDWARFIGDRFIETVEKVGIVVDSHPLLVVVRVVGGVVVLRGLGAVVRFVGHGLSGGYVFPASGVE